MAFSNFQRKNFTFWRQGARSNPGSESDTIVELIKSVPGVWCYPTHPEHCCIYRVPERLRRVNEEAYTPQLVLIGPLHHHLKSQAIDITNRKSMGYLNMEEHKKFYLEECAQRLEDKDTIDKFRDTIKAEEGRIRASYSESTSWINSLDFVEMILLDSVFILEFISKIWAYYGASKTEKTGDIIVDENCLVNTVLEDLLLLENQLPYFILEKLFSPVFPRLLQNILKLSDPVRLSFRDFIVVSFGSTKSEVKCEFKHFTDLLRCVRVETPGSEKPTDTKFRHVADLFRFCCLKKNGSTRETTKTKFSQFTELFRCGHKKKTPSEESTKVTHINHMYNAEKLYSGGVEFEAVAKELSIDVRFDNGCLKIPYLWIRDDMEIKLRNIMALEQCHYPSETYVCGFILFLDFLINCDKDVDLLIDKGILKNWIGEKRLVAEMVNKLGSGIVQAESRYSRIANKVNAYYENPINRCRAILGRVYFSNLWTGTATVAATLLLVMTLIQTVASIIQAMQK